MNDITCFKLFREKMEKAGEMKVWLRKNVKVSGRNKGLWPAFGNEWANKMTDSSPCPSALCSPWSLIVFFSFISADALNLSQRLPHGIIIWLNWAIMRLVNLILSQNQINPYDRMHMRVCQHGYVRIVHVCVWIHYVLAKTLNPRSVCWINQRSISEWEKKIPIPSNTAHRFKELSTHGQTTSASWA